jgi:hypothetical protein
MNWFGSSVVILVALAILLKRREFASFQANVLGGSILPGCVIAEAVVLLAIAVAMLLLV